MTDNFAARILNKLITFYELLSPHQRFSCGYCCQQSAQKKKRSIDRLVARLLVTRLVGWLYVLSATCHHKWLALWLFGCLADKRLDLISLRLPVNAFSSLFFVLVSWLCVFLDTSSLKAKQIAVHRQAAKRRCSTSVAYVSYSAKMSV